MKSSKFNILTFFFFISLFQINAQADIATYLDSVKADLHIHWPKNKTVKLLFHGHSVPAGYFRDGEVKSLESYPYLSLKKLNEIYPYAVINPIVTAIGGEQSEEGAERFEKDVLALKPDVIFIDYSLNDRRIGLERAYQAWESMIVAALQQEVKVILFTPTPDLKEDIQDSSSSLSKHSKQVRALADKHKIGLVDSYAIFQKLATHQALHQYMSQGNHVNGIGHDIVSNEVIKWFLENEEK